MLMMHPFSSVLEKTFKHFSTFSTNFLGIKTQPNKIQNCWLRGAERSRTDSLRYEIYRLRKQNFWNIISTFLLQRNLKKSKKHVQYNYWYGKYFKMRNSALEGKILVFTSFVLSKITFHFYMSKVPNKVVREFQST